MPDDQSSEFSRNQQARQIAYRELCDAEPSIPLFSQAWWLDALAEKSKWDVALVQNGDQIVASMPYVIRHRMGSMILGHPPLTQTLGPWLRETGGKQANRLSRQKDLLQQLIEALPHYAHFSMNWHHSQTNWLPFYWAGFTQTTHYTYRLPDLSDEKVLWAGLRENIRGDIRKAQNRFGARVRTDLGIDEFLQLNAQTFARQGMEMPDSPAVIQRLDDACQKRAARQIFIAEDSDGKRHAGVYIVWDSNSAYYLMGGGDSALRNSGATSLCIWEAIKFAWTVTKSFDFEGSMIEPIERFFRAFGAEQTPYFSISHTPSRMLKAYRCLRGVLK
jgi:hypothetical protein